MNSGVNRRGREGSVIVISAPSGSGKSTVVRRLLRSMPGLEFSVSYATRPPRKGERDGREYHFVSVRRFRDMIAARDFAEWARVYGNYYGTSLTQIHKARRAGRDILLDIDVQGHQKVKRRIRDAVSVFLLPPSFAELHRRLVRRHADAADVIRRRLDAAKQEIRHWPEYDYVVVNDDIRETIDRVRAIVTAARFRQKNQEADIRKICKTFGG